MDEIVENISVLHTSILHKTLSCKFNKGTLALWCLSLLERGFLVALIPIWTDMLLLCGWGLFIQLEGFCGCAIPISHLC